MKLKYYKNIISGPSHLERVWKVCFNRRKLIEFVIETSPHGFAPCVLVQLGGDAWFTKIVSVYKVSMSFSLVPCV